MQNSDFITELLPHMLTQKNIVSYSTLLHVDRNQDIGRKKIEFCVIQELLLRFYNKTKKDNKIWFLNPSEAIVNNI